MSWSVAVRDQLIEYGPLRFVDRDMLMRYHFGLGVGHVYSHSTSPPVLDTINEVNEEPTTASGSQITSVLSLVRDVASHSANLEAGGDEVDQSDEDSSSDDAKSMSLGSDQDSDTQFNEAMSDWDEELIAEEMYEE